MDKLYEKKISLSSIKSQLAHQINNSGISKNHSRNIICTLFLCNEKMLILKKCKELKGISICINENFIYDTMIDREQLWEKVGSFCCQAKLAYLNYMSIVVNDKVTNTISVD